MASDDRLRELEEKYEGYKVYDNSGDKIGKVDDLFIDESDREEYIGVKMGLFGTKSTLIPMDIVRVNESDRTIEVSESKDHVKDAPNFSDDDDITPEYEDRIRGHFGLESLGGGSSRGSYSGYGSGAAGAGAEAGAGTGATRDRDTDDEDTDYRGLRDTGDSGARDHDEGRGRETSASSGVDSEYGERAGSSDRDSGSAEVYARDEGTSGPSASSGGDRDYGDSSERSGEGGGSSRAFGSGSSSDEAQQSSSGSSFGEGETREMPTNRRQTEETETFQEGGRTKVRRRIVREEIIEEDPDQR